MQLIVLGMHRSGTSSVTRLLNLAGAYFGPEGIATDANEENPKGFWERRDVRAVCDGLLHGGGFDWWQVAGFAVDEIPEQVRAEGAAAFRKIVMQLDAHRPWVLKEPRLCLLLPILRPALEAPVLVHVVREPLEVAESLAARNGFPVPVGLALWEVYTEHAATAAAGEPSVMVSYGDLIRDPVSTTARLVDQLTEAGVQGLRMPSEREITAFVTPSLHRQRRPRKDRREYLNAAQVKLARGADEGRLPDTGVTARVSEGATATLRLFEHEQRLIVEMEAQRADAEAEQARLGAEHAEIVEGLTAAQRELELALEAAQREHEAALRASGAEHQRVEEELRQTLAAAVEATRTAELRAVESLGVAARRVKAVRGSGAVRLGARISTVRDRLRGRRTSGVDGALQDALRQLEQARAVLDAHLGDDRSLTIDTGPADPPPVEELRARRRSARARGDRARVAVVAWDVGHNPFGRAHLLADLLSDRFDVELWGSQFDRYGTDVWPPLRGTSIPIRRFPGSDFPGYLDTLDDIARRIDADAIYVSKPRLPSLGLGVLAKQVWNRPLIVDVDDFEPSFFDETTGVPLDELRDHRGDPDLALPFGRLWTRACETVVTAADELTVSNLELEARYGGVVVPHARDEAVFDPDRYDRDTARRRLGLGDADRLVLFGGTPRVHKGILELLEALEVLGDERIRVGAFATRELAHLRSEMGPLERWILPLPYQSFDELPALLAAADLTCALQSPTHPVSRYQMPAKVTDAMAMGLPCLVTAVPPLQPLIDKDVIEVFDGDRPLHERIREIFDHAEETADRARRAREVFLESFSYAAVRPVATAVIERHLDDPPPVAPALASLVTEARRLFGPDGPGPRTGVRRGPATPPSARTPVPAGSTYDLVVFWKQNDTGIYGRRQDMMLKYLERSGRFNRIVHFDQPMAFEALAATARRSLDNTDQNRLVLAQTLRRLAHRADGGRVRQRTYLYAGGRASRALRLPPRSGYADYVRSVLRREGIGQRPLMVWVYPTNAFFPELCDALDPAVVVADVVDDNRTWYTPGTPAHERLTENYADVLARSDVVLANCKPVAESMRAFAPRVEVLPNACELPDGAPAGERPPELRGLQGPVIGYAGNLSDRIDIDLLEQLVRARRDWSFVFIGSTHLDHTALQLEREPNVRFIGTKPYGEAQAIIRHFDVALIPHRDNDMTRSMNPLKAYVYVSLGVPIVSTPVANLDELQSFITVAEGPDEFVAAIEAALQSGRRVPERDALVPHSWQVRVDRVLELVDEVVTSRSNRLD